MTSKETAKLTKIKQTPMNTISPRNSKTITYKSVKSVCWVENSMVERLLKKNNRLILQNETHKYLACMQYIYGV